MAADLYQELGVGRDASADEIKRAYRDLAKRYHPDLNPGDEAAAEKFKNISHAYDVLKDDQSRTAYDRFGDQAFAHGQPGAGEFSGQNPFGADFSSSMSDIFGDLFSNFMGGGGGAGRTAQAQRGEDLRHDIEISLEEAASGTEIEFTLSAEENCAACQGSGAGKESQDVKCNACHGQGVLRQQSGFMTFERTCSTCGGAGRMMSDPCKQCSGQGRLMGQKRLRVKIPAGISEGAQMRLKNKGNAGFRSAPPGDLYLFVHIARHDIFDREGRNLFCTVPVGMTLAALGGEVKVPTLSGGEDGGKDSKKDNAQVSVKIPAGCQNGKRLRIRGKGIRGLHDSRKGDLFIDIEVETPVRLDAKQTALMEQLHKSLTKKNAPYVSGFAEKVHNIFEKFRSSK